ncbi:MAG: BrnT family toxin [Caldilineaceae bacterium]|nr:BrnT family toxin [Caldilineaceae bacterium]
MYIRYLRWTEYRIEHIAHHDVEPHEVEEVFDDPSHRARREGRNRYRVYGQTIAGRYLFVVIERVPGNDFQPITARNMTPGEKQNFRKLQK